MQLDNSYKKKVPHAGSRMLGFGERTVYLEYNGELQFLTYEQWKDYNANVLGREVPPCVYLFSIGEEEYFLTEIKEDTKIGFIRCLMSGQCSRRNASLQLRPHGICLCGIVTISSAADVGKNWFTAKHSGCFSVRAARTWYFRRSHLRSSWESRTAIKSS